MGKKKLSRAELEAENRLLRRQNSATAVASVANNLIRWGGLSIIAYFIFRSVNSLAGQNTTADIGIDFLTNIKISEAVAWIFGGGGVVYGLRQRNLRRDTTERMQGRISEFEKSIDPNRTSSGLTERGETHPKDEI